MASLSPNDARARALRAVEQIVETEAEPDEALRQAVAKLHELVPACARVALYFVEENELVLGPWSGGPPPLPHRAALGTGEPRGAAADARSPQCDGGSGEAELEVPVRYRGQTVAVLAVRPAPGGLAEADAELVAQVAERIAAHCLVGWDTGGVPWSDVS